MLDPWIIEEIRKREDLQRGDERPMLEIPLERPQEPDPEGTAVQEEDGEERGVVIVEFGV
jgi:hypothetical protein